MISVPNITLPRPTNRTIQGPLLNMIKDQFFVEYDFEMDSGVVEWSKIVFTEPLIIEFRNSACCRSSDVVGSGEVQCQAESAFLNETLQQWQESVGWQDWQKEKGGVTRFKHYTVWFDDAASLNIVASACHVEAMNDATLR